MLVLAKRPWLIDLSINHSARIIKPQLVWTSKLKDLMFYTLPSTCKSAVVLVCDVSNMSTLTHAAQWLQDAQDANPSNSGHDMKVMLVVNKRDMVNDALFGIVEVKARQMCLSLGAEYWAVSAKSGECVEDFFRRLAALVFNTAVLGEVGQIAPSSIKIGSELLYDANGSANQEVAKKSGCNDNKCG
uniref:Ras-related protein Rab-34-like n=2 Tax=Hirondellea gigas TaxID=1518452 RepID=A0A6A7G363_9CRUS